MSKRLTGAWKLSCIALALTAIWLYVLPELGQLTWVRKRIDGNRAAGINPTAVFYTDHPGMADIERRIEAKVYGPSASFWTRNK